MEIKFTSQPLSGPVINALTASIADGPRLRSTPDLDSKTYKEFKKLVETLGGRWVKSEDAHVFNFDIAPVITLLARFRTLPHKDAYLQLIEAEKQQGTTFDAKATAQEDAIRALEQALEDGADIEGYLSPQEWVGDAVKVWDVAKVLAKALADNGWALVRK